MNSTKKELSNRKVWAVSIRRNESEKVLQLKDKKGNKVFSNCYTVKDEFNSIEFKYHCKNVGFFRKYQQSILYYKNIFLFNNEKKEISEINVQNLWLEVLTMKKDWVDSKPKSPITIKKSGVWFINKIRNSTIANREMGSQLQNLMVEKNLNLVIALPFGNQKIIVNKSYFDNSRYNVEFETNNFLLKNAWEVANYLGDKERFIPIEHSLRQSKTKEVTEGLTITRE